MKIVAIKDMAAGNESIGTEWKETKIFDETTPLIDVMKWATLKTNVVLSVPENETEEFSKRQ